MELSNFFIQALVGCMEGLYVIREDTKEIIYVSGFLAQNKQDLYLGKKCHEVFNATSTPCSFCPRLVEHAPAYVWDCFDSRAKQWITVKNVLVRQDDVLYRVGNASPAGDIMDLSADAIREVGYLQRLVQEREEMRQQLIYEMGHDRLTGLFNRNQYMQDLSDRYQPFGQGGILYFDLNNLKETNDQHHHSAGDALLQLLSKALQSMENEERRCYRVGGDEFVLLWQGCTQLELDACQVQVEQKIKRLNVGQPVPCSVAVGMAWSENEPSLEALLSEADKKMYLAKQRMKNSTP